MKNPLSIHGIMILLAVFLFLESPRVVIASSNDKDPAASGTSGFDFIADGGGIIDKDELSAEYTGVTFNFGEAVITADYAKIYFKKNANGGLSFNAGSTENTEDSFKKIVIRDNVRIIFEGLVATGDKAVYDPAGGSFVLTGDPAALVNGPETMPSAEIETNRIVFDKAEARAEFIGDVIITREETVITADHAKAFLKSSEGAGFLPNSESPEKIKESFDRLVATGNVRIVFEERVATGDEAVYDSAGGSFVLSGDPATLVNDAGTISSAEIETDRVVFDKGEASAEFIGDVIITRGETVITADRAKAFLKSSEGAGSLLNSESSEKVKDSFDRLVATGNVKIVSEDRVATGNEAVYDSAAGSFVLTGAPSTLATGAGTTSSPLIEADRIVFNEAEVSAEFTGNVRYTQGETVITADNVEALFKKTAYGGLPRNEDSTENIGESVKRIVADGNVKIVIEGRIATGDEAVYDSAANHIVMTGDPAALVVGVDTFETREIEIKLEQGLYSALNHFYV